jgi:hypothetical protein
MITWCRYFNLANHTLCQVGCTYAVIVATEGKEIKYRR